MEKLVAIVAKVPAGPLRYDDDAVDRTNHRHTVVILVVFAMLISMQQYVGKPITCWVPKHFTGSHTKFTNSLCWVNNTYWHPFEEEIPKAHEDRRTIIYYQWMPFILLTQAFLFYVPCLIWRAFNSKAGVDSDNILATAGSFQRTMKLETRDRTLRLLTNQIDRFLCSPRLKYGWRMSVQHALKTMLCCLCGQKQGNYLLLLYLFVKVLYIANVFFQLFILNSILKTTYNLFGVEAIKNALGERAWLNATVFPKVTMCDFHIRILGNVQRYTVQCLLPINLYTEKMYMFLWFWMVFVLAVTSLNLVSWIFRAASTASRKSYIKKHLISMDCLEAEADNNLFPVFVTAYLKQDGVFLLRLIGHNTDGITVDEITVSLWDHWKEKLAKKNDGETLPLKPANGSAIPPGIDLNSLPAKRPAPPPPRPPIYRPPSYVPTTEAEPQDELDLGSPKMPSAPYDANI